MSRKLYHSIKKKFEPHAIVLMYHRVAVPDSDVWEIAVSPERFEQHCQVLKKMGNVISLERLVHDTRNHLLPRRSIAISFDDGYIDNLEVAKPLLEQYRLPATFFITSGNIGTNNEFWWDELEALMLFTGLLPSLFRMKIGDTLIESDLGDEAMLSQQLRQQLLHWKACTEAPRGARARLFYTVWAHLKLLPANEQQQHLKEIRTWANATQASRSAYRSMAVAEIKKLAASELVTIGAHTKTHPALAYHSAAYQQAELLENQRTLREITGSDIRIVSYPFGNYNNDTLHTVMQAGFNGAFTSEEEPGKQHTHPYRFGRFQVKNLTGAELEAQIRQWRLL